MVRYVYCVARKGVEVCASINVKGAGPTFLLLLRGLMESLVVLRRGQKSLR